MAILRSRRKIIFLLKLVARNNLSNNALTHSAPIFISLFFKNETIHKFKNYSWLVKWEYLTLRRHMLTDDT